MKKVNSNESESLIKTIASKSIEIISDNGEIVLDSLLDSGALKDIPIFGNLFKVTNLGISIRDYRFTKKLLTFLNSLNDINYKDRAKFIENHINDKTKQEELGEKILYNIEKIDTTKKAEYIARAFKLYLKEKISLNEFYDLIYTIEQLKLHYIDIFIDLCLKRNYNIIKPEIVDHFYTCGLILKDKTQDISFNKYREFDHEDTQISFSNRLMTDVARLLLTDIIETDQELLKSKYINKIMNINPRPEYRPFLTGWVFVKELTSESFLHLLNSYNLGRILEFDYSSEDYCSIFGVDEYNRLTKLKNGNFQLYKRIKN